MGSYAIRKELTRLGKYNSSTEKKQRDAEMTDNPYPYIVDSLLLITQAIEEHTEQLASNENQLIDIAERLAGLEQCLKRLH